MTDAPVYPITAAFERDMQILLENVDPIYSEAYRTARVTFRAMRGNIGEYEHGSADIEDNFPDVVAFIKAFSIADEDRVLHNMMLKAYADVCEDVLLTLIYGLNKP